MRIVIFSAVFGLVSLSFAGAIPVETVEDAEGLDDYTASLMEDEVDRFKRESAADPDTITPLGLLKSSVRQVVKINIGGRPSWVRPLTRYVPDYSAEDGDVLGTEADGQSGEAAEMDKQEEDGMVIGKGVGKGTGKGEGIGMGTGQLGATGVGIGKGAGKGEGVGMGSGQPGATGVGIGKGAGKGEGTGVGTGQPGATGVGVGKAAGKGEGVGIGKGQDGAKGVGVGKGEGKGEGVGVGKGQEGAKGVGIGKGEGKGEGIGIGVGKGKEEEKKEEKEEKTEEKKEEKKEKKEEKKPEKEEKEKEEKEKEKKEDKKPEKEEKEKEEKEKEKKEEKEEKEKEKKKLKAEILEMLIALLQKKLDKYTKEKPCCQDPSEAPDTSIEVPTSDPEMESRGLFDFSDPEGELDDYTPGSDVEDPVILFRPPIVTIPPKIKVALQVLRLADDDTIKAMMSDSTVRKTIIKFYARLKALIKKKVIVIRKKY